MVDFTISDDTVVDVGDQTALESAITGIPNTSKILIIPMSNNLQVRIIGYV